MDRKLTFDNDKLVNLKAEFIKLANDKKDISFEVWTEIPENLLRSYYNCEALINPNKETFEHWQTKLIKRPNPLYSMALIDNQIVSSVYGGGLAYERTMNLWATKRKHRQRGIGKIVLLNLIIHSFESNQNLPIKAWDITSQHVDNVLINLGFE